MTSCVNKSAGIVDIERLGSDLAAQFTMRYRLASDPDIDGSYTPVYTTKNILSVIYPYFDIASLASGTYVVHTYYTSDGPASGTKITVEITCEDISVLT